MGFFNGLVGPQAPLRARQNSLIDHIIAVSLSDAIHRFRTHPIRPPER